MIVTAGLKKSGGIIINTPKSPEEVRKYLKGYEGRVCTIDAATISEKTLGKNFPNTPMLGAVVKVSGVMDQDQFIEDMKASFAHKFATKPQVIEGNVASTKNGNAGGKRHMKNKKGQLITPEISWQEITPGGTVYEGGTAHHFKTGDWAHNGASI